MLSVPVIRLVLGFVVAALAPSEPPAAGSPAAVAPRSTSVPLVPKPSATTGEVQASATVPITDGAQRDPASADSRPAADSGRAADPSAAADTSRPRILSAKVLFITAKNSPHCDEELARLRRPGGDFALLTNKGWKIGDAPDSHLQIVDRETVADLVKQLGITRFPTVAAVRDGQIIRSFQYGCTTPLDKWTFGFLAKGIDERPPGSVPEAARVETTGNYPLRGNHWSVDDDWNPSRDKVVNHLRGPVHGGQTARYANLETWSYEELRSLHDNLHEIEMGGVQYGGQYSGQYSGSQPDPFSATRKTLGK